MGVGGGVQETKMRKMHFNLLNSFSGSRCFSWVVAYSTGQSGGMLFGVHTCFV